VYVQAGERHQGIATALMQDAIAYAQAHDYALLLLDGIPKFYHRYGYTDVYDLFTVELDRRAVLALPGPSYRVRAATPADAGQLLALYDRQFSPYSGSFEYSLEQQAQSLEYTQSHQPLLAIDPSDQVHGYLTPGVSQPQGPYFLSGTQVWGLAADDWPATLALLQHHMRTLSTHEISTHEISTHEIGSTPTNSLYSVPAESQIVYWLGENLEAVDFTDWDQPCFGWAVREQTFRHRNAGWMARLVDLSALSRARCSPNGARAGSDRWQATEETSLCPILTLLQPAELGQPDDLRGTLTILFAGGRSYIPPSDGF
jgi:hypothetical protein